MSFVLPYTNMGITENHHKGGGEENTARLLSFVDMASSNIKLALDKPVKSKRRVNHRKYLQKQLKRCGSSAKNKSNNSDCTILEVPSQVGGASLPTGCSGGKFQKKESTQLGLQSKSLQALFDPRTLHERCCADPHPRTMSHKVPLRNRNLPASFFTEPVYRQLENPGENHSCCHGQSLQHSEYLNYVHANVQHHHQQQQQQHQQQTQQLIPQHQRTPSFEPLFETPELSEILNEAWQQSETRTSTNTTPSSVHSPEEPQQPQTEYLEPPSAVVTSSSPCPSWSPASYGQSVSPFDTSHQPIAQTTTPSFVQSQSPQNSVITMASNIQTEIRNVQTTNNRLSTLPITHSTVVHHGSNRQTRITVADFSKQPGSHSYQSTPSPQLQHSEQNDSHSVVYQSENQHHVPEGVNQYPGVIQRPYSQNTTISSPYSQPLTLQLPTETHNLEVAYGMNRGHTNTDTYSHLYPNNSMSGHFAFNTEAYGGGGGANAGTSYYNAQIQTAVQRTGWTASNYPAYGSRTLASSQTCYTYL